VRVFLPDTALTNCKADPYRSFGGAGWPLTSGEVVDYRRVTDVSRSDARQLPIGRLTIEVKFQVIQIATALADQASVSRRCRRRTPHLQRQ